MVERLSLCYLLASSINYEINDLPPYICILHEISFVYFMKYHFSADVKNFNEKLNYLKMRFPILISYNYSIGGSEFVHNFAYG